MDALLPVVLSLCCGIDVHKKTLTACPLQSGASGETTKLTCPARSVGNEP